MKIHRLLQQISTKPCGFQAFLTQIANIHAGFRYYGDGEPEYTATDLDRDDTIDTTGPDVTLRAVPWGSC